jgi:Concanavalin A-like lectin/glucanases superfamily
MSRLFQKPVLHGRDHLPGGPDPIPGFTTAGGVVYSDYVQSFSSLIGYWRLGETGSPWQDETSYNNDLNIHAHGVAMTPDVTGGLPAGQDDGAVRFNYNGTTFNGGDWINTAAPSPSSHYQRNHLTVAAFVNVHAYPPGRGQVFGSITFLTSYTGWALNALSSGKIHFTLGGASEKTVVSPGTLLLDTWYHVAATYDGTTMLLYLNGIQVASTAFTSSGLFGSTDGVQLGTLDISSSHSYFNGTVDEAAVWAEALTADEIALLASAVDTGAVGDGDQVFVSDGAGGSHWGQANGNAIADASIVNRHVATGANIDVLKLAHPGGTSTFLRADGTWATPAAGSVATDTLFDVKGDLAAGTGADTAARLAAGSNGQLLSADSTTATGLKWVAAPSGSDPSTDTKVWMPLTTTVGTDDVLVFDANHQLIPTLTPI